MIYLKALGATLAALMVLVFFTYLTVLTHGLILVSAGLIAIFGLFYELFNE